MNHLPAMIDFTQLKPRRSCSPLVSVIVPCYNVEQYIDQCLISILNNGYQNIELICVNDRSTDSTIDHIKSLMKIDKRIQLFHNQEDHNIYGGACRNIGLEHATGKYVYFCDSDDYILPGLFRECVRKCEQLDADICCFKYQTLDAITGKFARPRGLKLEYLIDSNKMVYTFYDSQNIFLQIFSSPWTKIYRRDFIKQNGIDFQEIKNSNDNRWHIQTLLLSSRITHIDKLFYVYRKNTKTSVQSDRFRVGNFQNQLDAFQASYELVSSSKAALSQFRRWVFEELEHVQRKAEYVSIDYLDKLSSLLKKFGFYDADFQNLIGSLNQKVSKNSDFDVVVSMATYRKRFVNDDIYKCFESIVNQKCDVKYHFVVNMWKDDWEFVPQEMKDYFVRNNIEVILSNFNWKSNLKYIMTMKKYRDVPVITVDDDMVYSRCMVQLLWNDHLQNLKTIIGGRCRKIVFDNNGVAQKYSKWRLISDTTPSIDVIPTGAGGVLYPIEFCGLIDESVEKLVIDEKLLTRDDFLLHYLAQINNIQSKLVSRVDGMLVDEKLDSSNDSTALWNENLGEAQNDNSIHLFSKQIKQKVF